MWYNYYAKKGLFHLLEKEKITMKIAKRVLSIVMSLIMIFGVCAVVTVSAAENPTLDIANYDSNYVLCFDEYIREYNYGTGMTAAWPRQVSFNEYGWMRIRSQTPEEIAAAAVYFASDSSAYTTGQILTVSGGFGLATPLYGDLVDKINRR